jgi:hypothetical protein
MQFDAVNPGFSAPRLGSIVSRTAFAERFRRIKPLH